MACGIGGSARRRAAYARCLADRSGRLSGDEFRDRAPLRLAECFRLDGHAAAVERPQNRAKRAILERFKRWRPALRLIVTRRAGGLVDCGAIRLLSGYDPAETRRQQKRGGKHDDEYPALRHGRFLAAGGARRLLRLHNCEAGAGRQGACRTYFHVCRLATMVRSGLPGKRREKTQMTTSNATHGFSGNKRRLLKGSLAAAATACTVGLPSIVRAQRVKTFRFGSPTPPGSIYNQAMELFVSEVQKQSGDKLKIELYPSSQLGSIRDMLQAVAARHPVDRHGGARLVFGLGEADRRVQPALHHRLRGSTAGGAQRPVGRGNRPERRTGRLQDPGLLDHGAAAMVNNVRPIRRPDDLKGLKIRVINSPVFLQTFRALGANPVGLDSAEMYLALQQKTVDGADNAATDIVNLKLL